MLTFPTVSIRNAVKSALPELQYRFYPPLLVHSIWIRVASECWILISKWGRVRAKSGLNGIMKMRTDWSELWSERSNNSTGME